MRINAYVLGFSAKFILDCGTSILLPSRWPRMPPGLIAAYLLNCRRKYRVKKRKRKLEKAKRKKPAGYVQGLLAPLDVFLFSSPEEAKYDKIKICIRGTWGRRKVIELLPGKDTTHNPNHAAQLTRAIKLFHRIWVFKALVNPWLWWAGRHMVYCPFFKYSAFKYICALIGNISERGGIHHFTDADPENEWNELCWFPYKAHWATDGYTPFPDFSLSNFYKKDIYYRVFADYLPNPSKNLEPLAKRVWKEPVFFEEPSPGVIRIAPIAKFVSKAELRSKIAKDAPTTIHFGSGILTDEGTNINFHIKEIANRTNLFCVGGIGSGKTNFIKGLLDDFNNMIEAQSLISEGWFFDLSPKQASGLGMYQSEQIRFAVNPQQALECMIDIEACRKQRGDRLATINKGRPKNKHISEWPLGKIIDGELFTAKFIMADEIQAWLLLDPEGKHIKIPRHDGPAENIPDTIARWCRELRALSMPLIFLGQDFRANQGVKTAIMKQMMMRMCLPCRDSAIEGPDYFAAEEGSFKVRPKTLTTGQFILSAPERRWDFFYGKTRHLLTQDND